MKLFKKNTSKVHGWEVICTRRGDQTKWRTERLHHHDAEGLTETDARDRIMRIANQLETNGCTVWMANSPVHLTYYCSDHEDQFVLTARLKG